MRDALALSVLLSKAREGGTEAAVIAWEGRAQINIAVLIERYLTESPPPGPTRHLAHYQAWADDLRAAGKARLEVAGARRFRVA